MVRTKCRCKYRASIAATILFKASIYIDGLDVTLDTASKDNSPEPGLLGAEPK